MCACVRVWESAGSSEAPPQLGGARAGGGGGSWVNLRCTPRDQAVQFTSLRIQRWGMETKVKVLAQKVTFS